MKKGKIKAKKKAKKVYSKKDISGMINNGEFDKFIIQDIEKDTGLDLKD